MGQESFCMFTSICFNFLLNISSSSLSSLSWCDEWKTVNPYHTLRQYDIFDGVPVPLRPTFILVVYISDKFFAFFFPSGKSSSSSSSNKSHTFKHTFARRIHRRNKAHWMKMERKASISSNHNLMSIQANQIGCTQFLLTQCFIPTDSRGSPSYARKPLELSIIFAQVSVLHSSSW